MLHYLQKKNEQTTHRKMRGGNQLTAAPGVLNAHRHNLHSGRKMTQRTGAPKTQERYITRGFDL